LPQVKEFISLNSLDSISIDQMMTKGSVNFSETNTKLDSCKSYVINGDQADLKCTVAVESFDRTATIQNIQIKR
jgi:hypothetical protein